MKQFFSVLRFELAGYFKNKVYTVMTLVLVLAMALVLSFPAIRDKISPPQAVTEGENQAVGEVPGPPLAVIDASGALSPQAMELFLGSLHGFAPKVVDLGEQAARDQVAQGAYEGAALLKSGRELTYIVRSEGLYDSVSYTLHQALQAAFRLDRLIALGASEQDIAGILMPPVSVTVENLGASQMDTFFYTYVLIMGLYMAILIYGQMVATSVATEKSSRTMELLITSARPNSLLFGKVIGSGLAGLFQMAAIFGSAIVFFRVNAANWAGNAVIASIFNMPPTIVGFALLFFVLGYFLYAFLFGAVGSLASRTEDINTSTLPITFGFVIAFIVVITGMASGNIDNAAMRFCSYLPFTSPMAMFVRVAMSSPAWYEIAASVVLLIASTGLIGVLSARIYRIGVLMYGKPPKLGELIRVLKASRNA